MFQINEDRFELQLKKWRTTVAKSCRLAEKKCASNVWLTKEKIKDAHLISEIVKRRSLDFEIGRLDETRVAGTNQSNNEQEESKSNAVASCCATCTWLYWTGRRQAMNEYMLIEVPVQWVR